MVQDPLARLGKLFDDNHEWAVAIARQVHRKLPPSFDVEDLEQIARIEMWKRCELYDPFNAKGVPFQAYAHVYVRGAVLMHCRRRNWREATHLSLSDAVQQAGEVETQPIEAPRSPVLDPEQNLIEKRERKITGQRTQRQSAWLRRAIDELSAMDAYLVKRYHVDGVDLDELAELVGIPRKLLWRRLSSIVRQLKKMGGK